MRKLLIRDWPHSGFTFFKVSYRISPFSAIQDSSIFLEASSLLKVKNAPVPSNMVFGQIMLDYSL
jgi:hypothetical protein